MRQTLWIGGAPGAGKTTVARRIARRHGFRLYSTDPRTWPHRDRALRDGNAAAARWERLRPADDWSGCGDADQLAMSLHEERGPMVLEDLTALPDAPLVVAEGSVLPAAAADRHRAVWLLPTPALQARLLAARGEPAGRVRLQTVLRETIAAEAATWELPVLELDGSLGAAALTAAVERRFAAAIAAGPPARDRPERQALVREANDALVAQARSFAARPWADGDADDRVFAFACECGETTCLAEEPMPVRAYRARRPLRAGGHGAR